MHPLAPLLRTVLNATSHVAPGLAGRAVFALFARPLGRSRPRPSEREVLAEARAGRLTVNGKRVVTYTWGDGERPVLLVHGWSSRGSRFTDFVTALRDRGYSPVAFDAPGHGDSEGRATTILEYREIIRQLHARHGDFEAVVAHSFGVLATFFALRDGVVARRIVGVGGVGSFDYLVDGFCAGLGLRDRLKDELRRHIEGLLFPGEPGIWQRFNVAYRPEEVGVPVLLFHDEGDDMVPLSQSRLTAAAHGERARLVVTRGLGHRRILADPQVVAEAVAFAVSGRDEAAVGSHAPDPAP
ncbi:alpha/beta hydrolase [Streptomyces lunaelactis]|uniref:alpha/beta hydrolase n=1 Tax=Streptomyces lunaelactis TaxID=1535768 RepID=UPI001584C864|nr:alpha/beta hydrolase [Streptomyces lunaelactis]NUK60300.1 alpha/beta hydrolase [Streptomyces lunaelactis]